MPYGDDRGGPIIHGSAFPAPTSTSGTGGGVAATGGAGGGAMYQSTSTSAYPAYAQQQQQPPHQHQQSAGLAHSSSPYNVRDLGSALDQAASAGQPYQQPHSRSGSVSAVNGSQSYGPMSSSSSNGGRESPARSASSAASAASTIAASRLQNLASPPPQVQQNGASSANGTATAPPQRSRNPLIDLIDTEKGYVDDMALIIKKVAAAWSRSNFPPPALDRMFRAIEAVYRIDKQFLAKLNEIGPNPSSPKALGDLLMRWIDDLEPAYTKYVNAYHTDFDNYQAVQSNANLGPILDALPPLNSPTAQLDEVERPITLDALFALPLERMQYYKKLYGKLLKSTQPGKSDHNLLVGANEKLDWLVEAGRQSGERRIGELEQEQEQQQQQQQVQPAFNGNASIGSAGGSGESARSSDERPRQQASSTQPTPVQTPQRPLPTPQTPQSAADNDKRTSERQTPSQVGSSQPQSLQSTPASVYSTPAGPARPTHLTSAHSSTSSAGGKTAIHPLITSALPRPVSDSNASAVSASSVERSSGQTTASTTSTAPTAESANGSFSPLTDLERRLDTCRTLDIFTMKPKKCKLQMHPPNLTYKREIRQYGDVQVSFFPSSSQSPAEVFTPSAIIYLLTDLFLLCERIPSPATENRKTNPNADLWLMYPPLATKHLKAYPVTGDSSDTAFEIEVMRKERMTVFAESRDKRDEWLETFQEAINFGGGAGALRVNTDLPRALSPNSVQSMSAGGRNTSHSFQSGSVTSGSNLSSLPPLPPSATASSFPSASPSPFSSRAPTPQDAQALPMQQRPLPQPMAMPHSQSQPQSMGRTSPMAPMPPPHGISPQGHSPLPPPPRGTASLGPPQGQGPWNPQSPPMRSLPSPMQQSFSQPSLSRPNPYQNGPLPPPPQGQPQYDQYGAPIQPPMQHRHPQYHSPHDENLPPGHPGYGGNMGPPPPHPESLGSAPSMRSMGSLSSRSSKTSGPSGASTMPSPVPPLPNKEQYHHDWQAAQAANARMEYGMQPDMRNGGLLSPSNSQQGMSMAQMQAMGQDPRSVHRSKSAEGLRADQYRMPSAMMKDNMRGQSMPSQSAARSAPGSRAASGYLNNVEDDVSPPTSPSLSGPVTNQLAAQMKCKVFVQSAKSQWKSLGTARLKLYLQSPGNRKQLVVEDKTVLISTIVLEDGVERVGKTGVAIELSDNGQRTGLIYMLQLKTEQSATGLFQQLLLGSSRASAMALR